jgi:hypothetical protein
MSNDEQQIAAIKTALAAIDSSISQTQSALTSASNPDDIRGLTSTLVDLRSERSRLQAQLDNLEAAGVTVPPVPAEALAVRTATPRKASLSKSDLDLLHKHLGDAITDRSVVNATLKSARAVVKNAKRLRVFGDDPNLGAADRKR